MSQKQSHQVAAARRLQQLKGIRRALRLETLESRKLMAANVMVDSTTGANNIQGTPEDDQVLVSVVAPGNSAGQTPFQVKVDVNSGRGWQSYKFDLKDIGNTRGPARSPWHIHFEGHAGNATVSTAEQKWTSLKEEMGTISFTLEMGTT